MLDYRSTRLFTRKILNQLQNDDQSGICSVHILHSAYTIRLDFITLDLIQNRRMKIGMNLLLWTTDINEDLYPIVESLKETGFDGVEVPIGDEDVNEYRKLGKKLKELELGCTCVTSVFEAENPASADSSVRAKAVEQLK